MLVDFKVNRTSEINGKEYSLPVGTRCYEKTTIGAGIHYAYCIDSQDKELLHFWQPDSCGRAFSRVQFPALPATKQNVEMMETGGLLTAEYENAHRFEDGKVSIGSGNDKQVIDNPEWFVI